MMSTERHFHALRTESAGLALAARRSLDKPIPSCPGWSMADLVWHTGTVMHWVARVLEARASAGATEQVAAPEAPRDDQLVAWFEEGADLLSRLLTEHDPRDDLGRQFPDGYGGPSLYRHYAREISVHRWDAEDAWGEALPIDDALASDWLDDLLVAWLPNAAARGNQAQAQWAGEVVAFHRSDGPGNWAVRLRGPGTVEPLRGEADADVRVFGTGSSLLLLALNRIPLEDPRVHIVGDLSVLERWRGDIRFGRPVAGPHWLGSPRPSRAEESG